MKPRARRGTGDVAERGMAQSIESKGPGAAGAGDGTSRASGSSKREYGDPGHDRDVTRRSEETATEGDADRSPGAPKGFRPGARERRGNVRRSAATAAGSRQQNGASVGRESGHRRNSRNSGDASRDSGQHRSKQGSDETARGTSTPDHSTAANPQGFNDHQLSRCLISTG